PARRCPPGATGSTRWNASTPRWRCDPATSALYTHVRTHGPVPAPTEGTAVMTQPRNGTPNRTGVIAPAYTGRLSTEPVPRLKMPDSEMEPEAAYRFIHDELMLDGNSRLNLATFVSTWMDPE